MTDIDKLEALIQKAGLDLIWVCNAGPGDNIKDYCNYVIHNNLQNIIIFNHDLAKALFGEGETCVTCGQSSSHTGYWCDFPTYELAFKYRIQQAVVSEDPIDYMYKAVLGDE